MKRALFLAFVAALLAAGCRPTYAQDSLSIVNRIEQELQGVNKRLDRLIELLEPRAPAKPAEPAKPMDPPAPKPPSPPPAAADPCEQYKHNFMQYNYCKLATPQPAPAGPPPQPVGDSRVRGGDIGWDRGRLFLQSTSAGTPVTYTVDVPVGYQGSFFVEIAVRAGEPAITVTVLDPRGGTLMGSRQLHAYPAAALRVAQAIPGRYTFLVVMSTAGELMAQLRY